MKTVHSLLLFLLLSPFLLSQTLLPEFVGTNGDVTAVTAAGNSVYIGGTFSAVSFTSGTGALLDTATGEADRSFPKFNDRILSIVTDGAGGWFVGGLFTHVQGYPIKHLAHINADRTVDTLFNMNMGGFVYTIHRFDSLLYLGGVFQTVNGITRNHIAAVNHVTRQLTPWNPNANNIVTAVYARQGYILAGGYFTMIGGQTQLTVAALDPVTGLRLPKFLNATGGSIGITHVKRFVESNRRIYFGGIFSQIDGALRTNLCAVDTGTLGVDSLWNPGAAYNGFGINDMLATGDRVYVAGMFSTIAGTPRNNLAALDTATAAAKNWNPNPNADTWSMTFVGARLAVGGMFSTIGGKQRKFIALLDTASGTAAVWDPKVDENVYQLSFVGGKLFAGGRFATVNAVPRANLAAVDAVTGKVRPWTADAAGSVNALVMGTKGLIVGGSFSGIGSSSQSNLVVVDTATGKVVPFFPTVNASVYSVHVMKTRIYAGGQFTSVGGNSRNGLAAFDAATGKVLPWNPVQDAGGAMAITGIRSTVYIAGFFNSINSTPRMYAAAFDTAMDQLLPWDPKVNGQVKAMTVLNGNVVLGGDFTTVNGEAHKKIAIVDGVTGTPTSFHAQADMTVNTVAAAGTTLFVGGSFTTVNGTPRQNFAMIDVPSSSLLPWDPNSVGQFVYSIALSEGRVYFGGNQWFVRQIPQRHLAVLSVPGLTLKQPPAAQFSARNVNFGSVKVGEHKDAPLQIMNTGEDTLRFDALTFGDPRFSLVGTLKNIPPQSAASETLRFSPFNGDTTVSFVLFSGNAISSPDTVLLSGIGLSVPRVVGITAGPDTIHMGSVLFDHMKDTFFTVTNTGNGILHVTSVAVVGPKFALRHTQFTVPAGATFLDTVRFFADAVGSFTALIIIRSDADTSAADTLVVTASCYKLLSAGADPAVPRETGLSQNYPNPFNPVTSIQYHLAMPGIVSLKVFDMLGKEVATLVNGPRPAGEHSVQFNAANLPSGIYFYTLRTPSFRATRRMLLLK